MTYYRKRGAAGYGVVHTDTEHCDYAVASADYVELREEIVEAWDLDICDICGEWE